MLDLFVDHDREARVGARRVTTAVFAAQGASVAAVFTTVPAVTERLHLGPLVMTSTLVGVALSAGVGSFVGLAAMRRVGAVGTMRLALLAVVGLLLLVGWASTANVAVCAYLGFGLALGAIDVSANSRAAQVERCYGRSVFGSFYAAWSAGGVLAALLTAGAVGLDSPVAVVLTAQAAAVLAVVMGIRGHALPAVEEHAQMSAPLGRRLWTRLIPFGVALMIVYVIDSAISAWSTVYLHQTLAASLAVAPLGYAAYQAGTVVGRGVTDRCVQMMGATAVVRCAALLVAVALVGLSSAPGWVFAVAAAGLVGIGTSTLAPLCLASAARLRQEAPGPVLARLNLFNYLGVITGGAASGLLGSSEHFRLAFAIPAALAIPLLFGSRYFTAPSSPRVFSLGRTDLADDLYLGERA